MKKEDYSNEVVKLNKECIEYSNSKEYKLGKKIYTMRDSIMHFRFRKIVTMFKFFILDTISKRKGLVNSKKLIVNDGDQRINNQRIALYSCVTGNYDTFKKPLVYDDRVSVFGFTEDIDRGNLPNTINTDGSIYKDLENRDKSRYIKMHPFDLFHEYDFSIYVDGNIRVYGDVRKLLAVAHESRAGLAIHLHPDRDCIYEEAKICELYGRGNDKSIKKQIKKYKEKGFPSHYGLLETGVIIADLQNPLTGQIFKEWWDEYYCSGSERDQLSLPFVLWSMGISMDDIGILGTNVRENPMFRVEKHNNSLT